MTRRSGSGWRWLSVTVVLAVMVALATGLLARDRARDLLAASVLTDARLRAGLLDREVARFELLPLALRDDVDVAAATASRPAALNRKLEQLARVTGAAVIYLVGPDGVALSASNWRRPDSFVGTDYRFRRYYRDARKRGTARQFARGSVSGRSGLYLARRTAAGGVIVVKVEFDRLEADWARAGGDTIVRNAEGVVLVSSRPAWRFATTTPLSPARLAAVRAEASLPDTALRPLPDRPDSVSRSVATAQPGWTLTLRKPLPRDAGRTAALGAALAVAALAALAWGLRQRALLGRRRTAELEEAVRARTAALTREIEERAASEARAAELREGLRQANRLATLGQVTAGVAHETAQPVAAIRTYAATTAALIDRGDPAAARSNLDAIARLCDRIGTITAELRGFSRRQAGGVRAISLAEVVDGALLMLKEQLRSVSLVHPVIDPDLLVRGGRVRLEQVLVNVLQNAVEAQRGCEAPHIEMALTRAGASVTLTVSDNGPGIDPKVAARLFTPFVTSRPDGLGLGLVIAHDIMTEFEGALRLVPSETGACFAIEMVAA
ncbi:ATP-binding protein [Sphingomonas sp. 1P06PA]|uniref:sensor histidine kinase n=1 Tax=Sphingomonas sp. 1P06PA TaxID=554121 RepID=UPI0039A4E328